jgi:tRNA (mo5U34)-methyltransferase
MRCCAGGAARRHFWRAAEARYDHRMHGRDEAAFGAAPTLSRAGIAVGRFGALVRTGMRVRRRFEEAKRAVGPVPFEWYPYDSLPNLFYLQHLLKGAAVSLRELAGDDPVLDIGAADGFLSFLWEALGHPVDAVDFSGCNINRMDGLRTLAARLGSKVQIHDLDLDGRFELARQYGVAFFLGTLYHLKNPFYALETIARHARYCFVSTRVARLSADRTSRLDGMPVAYLLAPGECNGDATNYFVFSPTGLTVLVQRAGWIIRGSVTAGASESDPISPEGDERMYLLLESAVLKDAF